MTHPVSLSHVSREGAPPFGHRHSCDVTPLPGGWQAAVRHDTVVSRRRCRRRRRVTFFAFPSGGAPTGASLHLRLPQSNDGGPAPSTQRSQTASTAPTAALTGAPPPPARLDSTQRGQTCRVVSAAIGGDGAVVWGVFEYSVKGVQGPSSGVEFASVSAPVVCRHETCM